MPSLYRNKDMSLSAYAFACGYVEVKNGTRLWSESGIYFVSNSSITNNSLYDIPACHSTRSLKTARQAFAAFVSMEKSLLLMEKLRETEKQEHQ